MSRKSRKQKIELSHLNEQKRDISREQEVLNSEIYKDPTIQEILRKIVNASELEAVDLALQLQKVARGKASLLETPELGDVVAKMRQEAANRDAASASFEADRQGFIDGLFEKGDKIKKTGLQAEYIKAAGAKSMAENIQAARLNQGLKRKKLEYDVSIAPKEKIFVRGVNTLLGGSRSGQWEVWPEEIRIGHLVWRLPEGEQEVPKQVADAYRQKLRNQEEGAARKKALSKFSEDSTLSLEWNAINKKYSGGESLQES